MMKTRKRHSNESGYVAERLNPNRRGHKVVIYLAEAQGIDVNGLRYATVCDQHGQVQGWPSLPKARFAMKNPDEFCTDCRNEAKGGG